MKLAGEGGGRHHEDHVGVGKLYIRNTNVKQHPEILIVFLLINKTDNRQGEL